MGKKDVYNVPPALRDKAASRMATEVAPLRKQPRTVNAKEWKFITELVSGDGRVTMKEAAIRAGYKPSSASVMAWKLTNPEINPAGPTTLTAIVDTGSGSIMSTIFGQVTTLDKQCTFLPTIGSTVVP